MNQTTCEQKMRTEKDAQKLKFTSLITFYTSLENIWSLEQML